MGNRRIKSVYQGEKDMNDGKLTLEVLGVANAKANREHITNIYQQLDHLTNRIADLQIEINKLKEKKT